MIYDTLKQVAEAAAPAYARFLARGRIKGDDALLRTYGNFTTPEAVLELLRELAAAQDIGMNLQRELGNREKELAAAQDTRIREGIEVEKMLCDVLGRPWAASGFSIETLILDIKAELAELKGRAR